MKKLLLTTLAVFALFALSACGESDSETDTPTIEIQALIEGNTNLLVGFDFGDPADYERVIRTYNYRSGGEIYLLKDGSNDNLFLFFALENEGFSGLAADGEGDFFGIILGQDDKGRLYDLFGTPDIYEESSDMTDLPLAIFAFENATLYVGMNQEHTITYVFYRLEGQNVTETTANVPIVEIYVGETFRAELNALFNSMGTTTIVHPWGGKYFGVSNIDGDRHDWALSVVWRSAENFIGYPDELLLPESWPDATEFERNQYFIDYLISENNLEPDHEIEEVVVQLFWPADGLYDALYTEIIGKMVQFTRNDVHIINVVIEFYSYFMQFDEEGAFFITFINYAEDENRFNENQAIFEFSNFVALSST